MVARFGFRIGGISYLAVAFTVAALVATSAPAGDGEWCIPPGYFSPSGGFYTYDCNGHFIDRFVVPPGCNIPVSYRTMATGAFAPVSAVAAGQSWYRGDPPTYCDGPRIPAPPCVPTAVQPNTAPEEVLPGTAKVPAGF